MSVERTTSDRSIGDLLTDLSRNTSSLFRNEIELVKAETSEKISQTFVAIGSIAGGAILAMAALLVLLQALVIAITELGVPPTLASLLVGGIVAIIAFIMIQQGTKKLKASQMVPERSISSLKRDAQLAQEQVK